ncbi:3'(2'),5'-bisphosphate nucleotidase CysQ [Cypionkella sp.]|uniref:3'(2'),5'-bisphosphate nucleotidase CysQ n=1 Tax=Cypionkella sp. TaxID=2811411 RepID=UPI00261BB745|nr:3'(2'),5'-bisphosphate nucleotidase CysQ [Cypionkella sp.]MDB5664468.1 3(2),5-bisphosphate nucleotidase CysQ [Cypionkella sp.]
MPARDLALLTEAARAAGEVAMRYWKNAPKAWNKADASPVTEADLACNDLIQGILRRARPDYGWLSEETPDDTARLDTEHQFIIDPIDGTRAFIAGEKHFSHSLAVARNGEITAAVVYLPALDKLYPATNTGPALRDGAPIQCSQKSLSDGTNILTSRHSLDPEHWTTPPDFQRSFRASLAYRLCLVADGSFDGMITFMDAWEWDVAAGSLIAARAGAAVSDKHGQALRFNAPGAQSAGTFACAPALHRDLMPRIKQ